MFEVADIEVTYPTKAERAAAAGTYRKKPAARIIVRDEGGAERTLYVPARVARAFEKDIPSTPLPYEELRQLVFSLEDRVCYAVTVDMLSRRDHATAELTRKLQLAGYRDASIDAALARAQEARFVDDSRFASYFIEERLRRGWGRRKIEAELAARGVDTSAIPGYPEAYYSDEEDMERARALLARKPVPEARAYEKLMRHLISKGYSYAIASQAVRERLSE